MIVAATERGVCAIALGDDAERLAEELRARYAAARFLGEDERLREWVAAVVAYIETPAARLDLPLDVRGTGALSGYRWGPERKRELLAREKAANVRRKTKRTA